MPPPPTISRAILMVADIAAWAEMSPLLFPLLPRSEPPRVTLAMQPSGGGDGS